MSNRHRKLRMEQMEARQMMAADVVASVQNGNLVINENPAQVGGDNAIRVRQINNTEYEVVGINAVDGSIGTVNGQARQVFMVTGGLNVNLGGGNDRLVVEGAFAQVQINTGAPALTKTTTPTMPTNFTTDHDEVTLMNLKTRGLVSINTGIDHDVIWLAAATIGDPGLGSLSINSGAGADRVNISSGSGITVNGSVDIQTFGSPGENDADSVHIERLQMFGDLRVRTGGGNDQLTMKNMIVFKNVDLDLGAGDDNATLDHVTAIDSLMARMGDGNDVLSTNFLNVKALTLDAGAGYDTLQKAADQFIGSRVQTGWESINGLAIADTIGQPTKK